MIVVMSAILISCIFVTPCFCSDIELLFDIISGD